ncbi:AraC family transcriptional regulator [Nitratidesulfovibrio vulgaris]|uniref:AraC family transcriptional regulator n=1 Tax=Nitratidesulfovibrio vulgaris TaxID=881 RepID=UPI002301E66E|nr:AraC family transcriptional regulator [Nitratidesulfovibrio vulgaris]WCB46271.1 AraC family transcriptional regulator [Nitratidesulfovibrio vulgaris]
MQPSHDVRFWRDADLPDLEVKRVVRSSHSYPRHTHDTYVVGAMEEGASYCLGATRSSAVVAAGQLCLINPGQVHTGEPLRDALPTFRMFYVEQAWVRRLASELTGRDAHEPEFDAIVRADREMLDAFMLCSHAIMRGAERLAKESAMVRAFSLLLTRGAALRAEPALRRSPASRHAGHMAVLRVREHLSAHLGGNVSLEDLAGATGLSRYHLLRVFRSATGMTPHAYHLQLRVEKAKHLLRSGWTPAEAAADTGFADQSHFTNTFRRFVGATPGQYLNG